MNFFSHYHFYRQDQNPWYSAGLLFPDLLRNFTTSDRISDKKEVIIDLQNQSQYHLKLGIYDHFKADKLFHNWDWFKEKNEELAHLIRNSGLGIKRDWFLAHIFIELAIDHVLVKENETQVTQLYQDLANCHGEDWSDFFHKNNFIEIENWLIKLEGFIKHHYIMTYKNTENVIYALSRIYLSTGIGKFETNQSRYLEELLNTFVPEVKFKISELRKILE